jgi:hypothetical protein
MNELEMHQFHSRLGIHSDQITKPTGAQPDCIVASLKWTKEKSMPKDKTTIDGYIFYS